MNTEEILTQELHTKHLGDAQVSVNHLTCEPAGAITIDEQHVTNLVAVFRSKEVNRLDPRHYLHATLERSRYEQARAKSYQAGSPWIPRLEFEDNHHIACLHGRHRLEAAKRAFSEADRWWVVSFYDGRPSPLRHVEAKFSQELSPAAILYLKEHRQYERRCTDGEVFLRICYYFALEDSVGIERWLGRLASRYKAERVMRRLLNRDGRWLFDKLRSLVGYRGLWRDNFTLGNVALILSLQMQEELSHYLQKIYDGWYAITLNDPAVLASLDKRTVESLRGLAPQICQQDAEVVRRLEHDHSIFPGLSVVAWQETFHRILAVGGMIFTLRTFFEDSENLHPVVRALRLILPAAKDKSLQKQLKDCATNIADSPGIGFIEHGPGLGEHSPVANISKTQYHQLVTYAIRHAKIFRTVPLRSQVIAEQDSAVKFVAVPLAQLATKLGITTEKIKAYENTDSDTTAIKHFLETIRPSSIFQVKESAYARLVQRIKGSLLEFKMRTEEQDEGLPHQLTHLGPKQRCGRLEDPTADEQSILYLPKMLKSLDEHSSSLPLSIFLVRVLILDAFFALSSVENSTPPKSSNVVVEAQPIGRTISQDEPQIEDDEMTELERDVPLTQDEVRQEIAQILQARDRMKFVFLNLSPRELSHIEIENNEEDIKHAALAILGGYFEERAIADAKFWTVRDGTIKVVSINKISQKCNEEGEFQGTCLVFQAEQADNKGDQAKVRALRKLYQAQAQTQQRKRKVAHSAVPSGVTKRAVVKRIARPLRPTAVSEHDAEKDSDETG